MGWSYICLGRKSPLEQASDIRRPHLTGGLLLPRFCLPWASRGTRLILRRLIPIAAVAAAVAATGAPAYASCSAPTPGYPGAVSSTSGLVGYWRLGETSGTAACDSTGAPSGTYTGGYTLGQ